MEDRSIEALFIYDAHFNVTGLVAYSGCGNQNSCAVLERYCYDPYGQVTVLNGEEDYDANAADWSADTGSQPW